MIKVNTNSWHYRLLDFAGINQPRTLCTYFWSVVFAPLAVLGMSTIKGFGFFFGLDIDCEGDIYIAQRPAFWTTLIVWIAMIYIVVPYVSPFIADEGYLIVLLLASMIIEFVCVVWAFKMVLSILDRREQRSEGDGFLTLTGKMISAVKQRVCPLIHYIEV